jgi:hypothetical protein
MKKDQKPSLDIAKDIPDQGIFVEIGTWEGGFSYELLKQTNCKKLYCVDPYRHFDDGVYPDAMNNLTQQEFDRKFFNTKNYLKQFGERVEFLRETSSKAATLFADNSIDFVYIDGNHDYSYVKTDILTWYPKIKSGGWMCGDDIYSKNLDEHDKDGNYFRQWSENCWGKYGTFKALIDSGLPYTIKETQFIIHKV